MSKINFFRANNQFRTQHFGMRQSGIFYAPQTNINIEQNITVKSGTSRLKGFLWGLGGALLTNNNPCVGNGLYNSMNNGLFSMGIGSPAWPSANYGFYQSYNYIPTLNQNSISSLSLFGYTTATSTDTQTDLHIRNLRNMYPGYEVSDAGNGKIKIKKGSEEKIGTYEQLRDSITTQTT